MESRRTLSRLGAGVSSRSDALLLLPNAQPPSADGRALQYAGPGRGAGRAGACARRLDARAISENLTAGVSRTPCAVRSRAPGPNPHPSATALGSTTDFRCAANLDRQRAGFLQ